MGGTHFKDHDEKGNHLMFEKVNPCHPDKVADRIAGALVDLAYTKEEDPKIAVEVLIGHGYCHIISETSVQFTQEEVGAIVKRIGGDLILDYQELPQDPYLAGNQEGSIRCGDPESEEEQVEMYISLPEVLFGKGNYYLLRAVGDSMEHAGISDGDLVPIRKQEQCSVGDIVVALDENHENTLKRYGGIDQRSKKAILEYVNDDVYPGKCILVSKLVLQGVAKHIIKDL